MEKRSIYSICTSILKWGPVILIITIVFWSYYAYVVELCVFLLTDKSRQVLYLIFYHLFFVLFLWSYWRMIFTDIGQVPQRFKVPPYILDELLNLDRRDDEYEHILEEFAQNLPIVNRNEFGSVRYCEKCQHIKPDRAHHCSVCERCILKMDHHCPWFNNCVSFYNYKFFILLLGYSLIYCIFIAVTTLPYSILYLQGKLDGFIRYHILFLCFVAWMFAGSLIFLFGYHCYLIYNNRTTLEAFRAPYFRTGEDKNGFNIGPYKNFQEVFGVKFILWFLPVYTSLGDGIVFPVKPQHKTSMYHSMGTTTSRSDDDNDETDFTELQTELVESKTLIKRQ